MTKIIDRTGKGSSISQAENDANLDSLCSINVTEPGSTYTVDVDNQNDALEFTNASICTVTLDEIKNGLTGILDVAHTSDFKITLISILPAVIINCSGTDTFADGLSSKTLLQYDYITLITDSTNSKWLIVNSSNASRLDDFTSGDFLRSNAPDTASGDLTFNGDVDLTGQFLLGGSQVTPTAAELNNVDGSTGATATTVADADRVVLNDSGVMKQVAVTDLDTYFSQTTKILTNKSLTSPNINSAPAYGMVVFDAPVSLFTRTTDTAGWTLVNLSAYTGATKAIIRVVGLMSGNASANQTMYAQKAGIGGAFSATKTVTTLNTTSVLTVDETVTEFIVNLDGSNDFEYHLTTAGTPVGRTLTAYIVGYYR